MYGEELQQQDLIVPVWYRRLMRQRGFLFHVFPGIRESAGVEVSASEALPGDIVVLWMACGNLYWKWSDDPCTGRRRCSKNFNSRLGGAYLCTLLVMEIRMDERERSSFFCRKITAAYGVKIHFV